MGNLKRVILRPLRWANTASVVHKSGRSSPTLYHEVVYVPNKGAQLTTALQMLPNAPSSLLGYICQMQRPQTQWTPSNSWVKDNSSHFWGETDMALHRGGNNAV